MKSRIAEEKKTVEQMIKLYCRHKEGHAVLCDACMALLNSRREENRRTDD